MALPSWFRQCVVRLRPEKKTVRGSEIPDWDRVSSLTIGGCSVQPNTTSLTEDGRILGASESFTLYMPPDADVMEGDRIVYNNRTFVVSGIPRPWVSATGNLDNKQVILERWEG